MITNLLISIWTSGKLSKYDVSSMDARLTEMAAGLSRRLVQSTVRSQASLCMSSRLPTRRSSAVSRLQRWSLVAQERGDYKYDKYDNYDTFLIKFCQIAFYCHKIRD